jgi:hypothetical protein
MKDLMERLSMAEQIIKCSSVIRDIIKNDSRKRSDFDMVKRIIANTMKLKEISTLEAAIVLAEETKIGVLHLWYFGVAGIMIEEEKEEVQ